MIGNDIGNDFEELKSRLSIIDVAERFGIKLSDRYTSKCPFADHKERTGSFKIYPKDDSFYCFGCCRGGDVVTLAKLFLGFSSNKEAGIYLNQSFGLELFKEKLTLKHKKEIQIEIQNHISYRSIIERLDKWAEEREQTLHWFFRYLKRIIEEQEKAPGKVKSDIYAFAKNEVENHKSKRGDPRDTIEDILDLLGSKNKEEKLINYKHIDWFIEDLKQRWENTIRRESYDV